MKKRYLGIFAVIGVMLVALFMQVTVLADEQSVGDFTVTTDVTDGYSYESNVLTITSGGEYTISGTSTADRVVITASDDVTVTFDGLSIECDSASPFEIKASGDVTIKLKGENTLKSTSSSYDKSSNYAGLHKASTDNTLTITSASGDGSTDGSLTATGTRYTAGIGGNYGETGCNIVINGGTITANGGEWGAGIGGGGYDGGDASNITIYGGTVNATAGNYAAGIGGGCYGEGSNITIYGGTVNAVGGDNGAGIGGGYRRSGSYIEIYNGDVTATAGYFAAGIGGGVYGSGSNITISGGIVTATGGEFSSAIGGGNGASGSDITINSGYITASAGSGADTIIGSGATIVGGYFADPNAVSGGYGTGTIYGIGVLEGYAVYENTNDMKDAYPYMIAFTDLSITSSVDNGYTYIHNSDSDRVIKITSGGEYTISMLSEDWITESDRIEVSTSEDVTVTLDEVHIASSGGSALEVNSEGNVTVKLSGRNILISMEINHAGLQKTSTDNTLTITSVSGDDADGELEAVGGSNSAGIGGGVLGSGSNIIISSGTIYATGGRWAAGIGGGIEGSGSNIEIIGGTITAVGGEHGAGIGGGYLGNGNGIRMRGGYITISGGTDADMIGNGSSVDTPAIDVSITGGYYADATIEAGGGGIIYGISISGRYYIFANEEDTKDAYPFIVSVADELSVTDGVKGGYAYVYGIAYKPLVISKGGDYTITMASGVDRAVEETIVVDTDDDVTITLNGVIIENDCTSPINIIGNGNVEIMLEGANVITSNASGCAGLQKNSSENTLTITNEEYTSATECSFIVSGGDYAAGIGGGDHCAGNNITISGITLDVDGGSYAAGIGGGRSATASNIAITGGYITASGGSGAETIGCGAECDAEATDILLTGGYYADTTAVTGGHSDGVVYGVNVADGYVVYKNGESSSSVYPYLISTNSDLAVSTSNTNGYDYVYYSSTNKVIVISSGGDYRISMNGKSSTSTDRIIISSNTDVSVTLDNVNIISNSTCPIEVNAIGVVVIKLSGTNTLTSNATRYAALQKSSSTNSLVITSASGNGSTDGTLNATGSLDGAGIGGGCYGSGNNIVINGGTVNATGGLYGAGIGGGWDGGANNINISGGIVNATGVNGGAGIGAGFNGSASNITISGGTVNAIGSGNGAGIGGGGYGSGSNITISGGTVTADGSTGQGYGAAGIGGGEYGNGYDITITGGEISATAANYGAAIGGGYWSGSSNNIKISGGYITTSMRKGNGSTIGSGDGCDPATNVSITGGCFGNGSTANNTVYGVSVAGGCSVIANPDTETKDVYPYCVQNSNALTDVQYNWEITDYTYGKVTLNLNESVEGGKTVYVMLVGYDIDTRVMTSCSIAEFETVTGETEYEVEIDGDVYGNNVKLFLWDENYAPIAEIKTL